MFVYCFFYQRWPNIAMFPFGQCDVAWTMGDLSFTWSSSGLKHRPTYMHMKVAVNFETTLAQY